MDTKPISSDIELPRGMAFADPNKQLSDADFMENLIEKQKAGNTTPSSDLCNYSSYYRDVSGSKGEKGGILHAEGRMRVYGSSCTHTSGFDAYSYNKEYAADVGLFNSEGSITLDTQGLGATAKVGGTLKAGVIEEDQTFHVGVDGIKLSGGREAIYMQGVAKVEGGWYPSRYVDQICRATGMQNSVCDTVASSDYGLTFSGRGGGTIGVGGTIDAKIVGENGKFKMGLSGSASLGFGPVLGVEFTGGRFEKSKR